MLDDLNTTGATNLMYFLVLATGIIGVWFFIKKKIFLGIIFWSSSILNLFFYLYFMGNYRLYPKNLYPIINSYWPWINVVLFIALIISFIKNKNVKTK